MKQPHEIDHLGRVLQTEFKGKTREEISRAIDMAMNTGSPSGSRVQISERARKILGAEARS